MATAFDPRAETLSPWLWIPIFVVALALFVFLSISRREIIFAAYDHSLALLRRSPLRCFLPGPIQLPPEDEYDSEEHDDELPTTPRPTQSIPARLYTKLRHSARHITLSFALWGSRASRLPTQRKPAFLPQRITTHESNSLLERVNSSPLATANPNQFIKSLASPRSPGRTSSPTLFDLGEEEEDAHQLESDLSTRHHSAKNGAPSQRGSAGGSW